MEAKVNFHWIEIGKCSFERDDELTDGHFRIEQTQAKVTFFSIGCSFPSLGLTLVQWVRPRSGPLIVGPTLEFHAVGPQGNITEQFRFFWLLRLGSDD